MYADIFKKFIRLIFGLYIYALGLVLCIYANNDFSLGCLCIGIKSNGISTAMYQFWYYNLIALFFHKRKSGSGQFKCHIDRILSDLIIDSK